MANNYWRERSLPYKPGQKVPFKLSRSKIELFVQCQRCFWLDVRLKIKRPDTPPFRINQAIDELLKKEFDSYRMLQKAHPLMDKHNVIAVPFSHEKLDTWRENFVGVFTLHEPTNLHIFGAIDDVWSDKDGKLIVVDYKATAKDAEVSIDADWQMSYKRQVEIYQWLLRANGFDVNNDAYFVYANGRLDSDGFNDRVEFRTKIIKHVGNADWVDETLIEMKKVMDQDLMPPMGVDIMGGPCSYCTYAKSRTELTLNHIQKAKKVL